MTNQSLALDRVFSALADPTRRGMVARLVQGPASVSELARPFSIALPTVVQHLKVLEASGLVSSAKAGRVRTCRLEQDRLDAAQAWLAEQKMIWDARFDRLESILKEMPDE
jgi:DNA-binding transcriptional ArsR family regulator